MTSASPRRGPLAGHTVVELAGLGPLPFASMMLADLGADVVTIVRPTDLGPSRPDPTDGSFFQRGKSEVVVDLKTDSGVAAVRELAAGADVFLEGFRPGVMERLGLGPDELLGQSPTLIYGRMTGWGQTGPLSQRAGHDINYIALAGALEPIGRAGEGPVPPLAMVGDFGGGGMLLALGVCAALVERSGSGLGQVVDAACVDGASLLMTIVHWLRAMDRWTDSRGSNVFDSGAPFYDVYQTADDRYLALGAVEPKFYDELVRLLDLDPVDMTPQYDRSRWPQRAQLIATAVRRRTRDEWAHLAQSFDACVSPVLAPAEVAGHPHHVARSSFLPAGGRETSVQPAPAPRFSRTRTSG